MQYILSSKKQYWNLQSSINFRRSRLSPKRFPLSTLPSKFSFPLLNSLFFFHNYFHNLLFLSYLLNHLYHCSKASVGLRISFLESGFQFSTSFKLSVNNWGRGVFYLIFRIYSILNLSPPLSWGIPHYTFAYSPHLTIKIF